MILCLNCGQAEAAHGRGPMFLHCDPRLCDGDEDCTFHPVDVGSKASGDPTGLHTAFRALIVGASCAIFKEDVVKACCAHMMRATILDLTVKLNLSDPGGIGTELASGGVIGDGVLKYPVLGNEIVLPRGSWPVDVSVETPRKIDRKPK